MLLKGPINIKTFIMSSTKNQRAYIKLINNKKGKTSSSKQYFHVFGENGEAYLFTHNDMEKALTRARKNPEDIYPVDFVEPKAKVKVVEKEVVKYIYVKRPSIISRLTSIFK